MEILIFRKKLFLILIAVIILFSCISILVMYNYEYAQKQNELFINAQNQSYEIDNYISGIFDHLKNDDEFLAKSPVIEQADNSILALFRMDPTKTPIKYSKKQKGIEGEIYKVFEKFGETHPDTCYAYMGTVWGGYISYPDGLKVNQYDPRIRPWYLQAMNNPDHVNLSDPYLDYSNHKNYIISASTTIRNSKKEIIGVMGLDISLDNLSKIIKGIKSTNGDYTFIFTKDGTIIAHPNDAMNLKDVKNLKFASERDVMKLLSDQKSNFKSYLDGKEVFINIYTSDNSGWKLVTVTPASSLYHKVNRITIFMSFVTLCIIAALAIFFYYLSRKITEPITELTSLMQLAEQGDLSVQADIRTKDEFRTLGSSFNSMIRKLDANYQELTAITEELASSEETIREQYEELAHKQETLRERDERYRLALEGSNDSIWELDLEKDEFFISEKFYEITGYVPEGRQELATTFNTLVHPEDKKKAKQDFMRYLKGKNCLYQSEFRIMGKEGTYLHVIVKGKALLDDSDKIIKLAGSVTDITSRKKTQEKLLHMAHNDLLTDLPNRAYFMSTLKEEIKSAEAQRYKVAVLFIDINNFKSINDTMGHDYGDKLLIEVSSHLKKVVSDTKYLCRFGGDEFVVLKSFKEEEDLNRFVNKLLNLFDKIFKIDDIQIYISASIGIAQYPKDCMDVNSLLKNADAAMYKAKEAKANRYAFFNEEIYLELKRKVQIQSVLRNAIENGELAVYYQPQYNPKNHEIYGFEALLRLNSKELGVISPAEFIPVAEETGLINRVGQWVLEEACRQSYEWHQKGYRFEMMCINISSTQLNHPSFFEQVKQVFEKYQIDYSQIELEITETSLMQSIDYSVNILRKLVELGVKIALDDFGTGYSSLNYLRKIPLTTLKVDKSFIDNICTSVKEEAIIKNIIEMAHSMELQVVAEGVEDEQQLDALVNINCNYIQGYYYCKPLPPDQMETFMDSNNI